MCIFAQFLRLGNEKKDITGKNSGRKKFYHWMHSCGMPICYALIWLIGAVVGKHYSDYNSLVLFLCCYLNWLVFC